jgi:hypothetical protein
MTAEMVILRLMWKFSGPKDEAHLNSNDGKFIREITILRTMKTSTVCRQVGFVYWLVEYHTKSGDGAYKIMNEMWSMDCQ